MLEAIFGDLPKYMDAVIWSWAATIVPLGLLIFATWRGAKKSHAALEVAEARARKDKG